MQNSKNRSGSSEVPQKTSPVTPRKLKVPASDSDSVPSPNCASRTPKDKCPKVVERRSTRSPAEKKRHSKVSELESQISQLQEELKKLTSSGSTSKRAQEETGEVKIDLAAVSAKLDASQKQLTELSASQNQHLIDIDNLRLELTETLSLVEKLKCQLSECEKSESRALELLTDTQVKLEMAKTVEENLRAEGLEAQEAYKLVTLEFEKLKTRAEGDNESSDKLKSELFEVKAEVEKLKSALDLAEKRCHEENIQNTFVIRSAHEQVEHMKSELALREVEMGAELERAKAVIEELKVEIMACKETKNENGAELDRAKAEIEELKAEIMAYKETKNENKVETKLKKLGDENEVLKAELERREGERKKENEEAAALVEAARASEREALMKAGYLTEEADKSNRKAACVMEQLDGAKAEIEELKAEIMAYKETKNENKVETELKKLGDENEVLKAELERREGERTKENEEAAALVETARASEREALMKVGYLTEEADKSNRKAARVMEQLEAVQGTNTEMEAELRRLKVQSDQWRKAAEAAAAMISSGHNGKLVERTGSLDKGYNTIGAKLGSPLSEDFDDESPKKKNGNMLRKFGFFGKKGQK